MKEKEFKKLKRLELVEIIYQLEKELEEERMENENLRVKLAEKNKELENTLSLESAVTRLNQVCESAEKMQKEYKEYRKKKNYYLKNKKSKSNPV